MSLCVKLYSDSDELFKTPLWQSETTPTTVVCPSPVEADRVRAKLVGNSGARATDVITISKFISNQLAVVEQSPEISRKADLLLKLSIFWKRVFPDFGHERFIQCFTLLTELRGTSLSLDSLQEVIEEYHPEVSNGVKMLWTSMHATDLHDEHSAYSVLAEAYRQSPTPFSDEEGKRVVFHGFGHLSGVQIDLLKAIAIRQEVIVPYRQQLYSSRHHSDWISWLGTDAENSELEVTEGSEIRARLYSFSKNRLAEYVARQVDDEVEVVLGAPRASIRDFLEIPIDGLFFKTPVDLLSESFSKIEDKVRILFAATGSDSVATNDVKQLISEASKDYLQKQDFRSYKAAGLSLETLAKWEELASSNANISTFDWDVMKECIRLMSPRVYQAPNLSGGKNRGKIRTFNESADIEAGKKVIVCITSAQPSFNLGESEYSQEVASLLAALGPRRRKELDFLKAREEFREMLRRSDASFFIEDGLLEHDLGWAEMLSDIHFEKQSLSHAPKKVRKDLLSERVTQKAKVISTFSPSRLQTYLDCPRRYYYQYVENVSEKPIKQQDLEPRFLGEIEHDVIDQYLSECVDWNEERFIKLCHKLLVEKLHKEKIVLEAASFVAHFQEIKSFSRNGINLIQLLIKHLPSPKLIFESEYQDGIFKGRVDLKIECDLGVVILDFKRSAASIPTKSAHEGFDKIQIWNYLAHANEHQKDILFWGYISLKDISASLLFSSWSEIGEIFSDMAEPPKIHSYESELLHSRLVEFKQMELELTERIKSDQLWHATPREIASCTFCPVNTLCSKGLV